MRVAGPPFTLTMLEPGAARSTVLRPKFENPDRRSSSVVEPTQTTFAAGDAQGVIGSASLLSPTPSPPPLPAEATNRVPGWEANTASIAGWESACEPKLMFTTLAPRSAAKASASTTLPGGSASTALTARTGSSRRSQLTPTVPRPSAAGADDARDV